MPAAEAQTRRARILATFVTLMAKAHSRGEVVLAESLLDKLLAPDSPLAPRTSEDVKGLVDAATVIYPVGAAEQEASIAAVAELGCRYEILRRPALAGMQSIAAWHKSDALDQALAALKDGAGDEQGDA